MPNYAIIEKILIANPNFNNLEELNIEIKINTIKIVREVSQELDFYGIFMAYKTSIKKFNIKKCG